MSLHIEIFNVVCAQCNESFKPTNRRQRFCKAACRVAAHLASKPKPEPEDLKFLQNQRSAIGMTFDGRASGVLRDVGIDRPAGYAACRVSLLVDCV